MEEELKRRISLIIVFAILLQTFFVFTPGREPVSYGAAYPGAEMLKKHGFIAGDEDGDLQVEESLSRAEACVILASIYGKTAEAQKFKYSGDFKDVKKGDWFAPYVEFAKDQGWVAGTNENKFMPHGKVGTKQWAIMLLRALNEEPKWETALAQLMDVGVKIFAMNPREIKRGEAFDALWTAVNTKPKGRDRILGEIVGKIAPKEILVTGVETPSLRIVRVQLSGAVDQDAAMDTANYTIKNADDEIQQILRAKYDEKNYTIDLILKTPMQSQKTMNLDIQNVSNAAKTPLVLGDFHSFNAVDTEAPSITDVQSLGTRALRVVFSEPVVGALGALSRNDFKFSKSFPPRKIRQSLDGMSAVIEFHTDINGEFGVTANDTVKDDWGFTVVMEEFVVEMKPDSQPIKLLDISEITSTGMTLRFNKDIAWVSRQAGSFMVHGRASDGNPKIDGNTVRVGFTKNYIAPGKKRLMVVVSALKDYSGFASPTFDADVIIPEDNTAPISEKGAELVEPKKISIQFNEGLDTKNSGLLQVRNYKLINEEDGSDISSIIKNVQYDHSTSTVSLHLSEAIIGRYNIVTDTIRDYAGNKGPGSFIFEARDLTPPNPANWSARVYNQGRANQMLKIRFDEPMMSEGKYSVMDLENYKIGIIQLDKLDKNKIKIELVDSGTSVEIKYPGKASGGLDFKAGYAGTAHELTVARVADVSGNYTTSFVSTLKLSGRGTITIEKAQQIEPNAVQINIFDRLENLDPADIIIERGSTKFPIAEITENVYNTSGTTIVLKTAEPILMPATIRTIKGSTVNRFGENFENSSKMNIEDKIGPALSKIDAVYDRFRRLVMIEFNESIDERTVSLLTFEMPGIEIENITANKNIIEIRIADKDKNNVKQGMNILQKVEIRDKAGNSTTGIAVSVGEIKN